MSDPTNVPEQVESGNASGKSSNESNIGPAIGHRKIYHWGWIVGIIVLLLIFWGFFGMDHEKPVIHPVMEPASTTSTIE